MAAVAAMIMTVGGTANAASVPESQEPIKLALNEWTGQLISTYILGGVLERMGYTVEYVTAGAVPQYSAMATGSLTANPENWDNNTGDRSEEHTSELQSLMRISYAVYCLKKKKNILRTTHAG